MTTVRFNLPAAFSNFTRRGLAVNFLLLFRLFFPPLSPARKLLFFRLGSLVLITTATPDVYCRFSWPEGGVNSAPRSLGVEMNPRN